MSVRTHMRCDDGKILTTGEELESGIFLTDPSIIDIKNVIHKTPVKFAMLHSFVIRTVHSLWYMYHIIYSSNLGIQVLDIKNKDFELPFSLSIIL